MANKNLKRSGKRHLKKGAKLAILVFILWTILGGIFLGKVIGPSVDLAILQDNHVFVQQHGNPSNYEAKDEAFLEYNQRANELINSDDVVVAKFFQTNSLVRILLILVAAAPYFLIGYVVVELITEIADATKKKFSRTTKRKMVRA